ncbi:MAG: ATP-binding cassette domain-containing protein [Pseudomonadota bacterium]
MSLKAPARGGIAVLGRNGAGKTTLLKTLIGELPTMEGAIRFDADEIQATDTEARVRRGMAYVPQEQAVFARLSVRDNLALGALAGRGRQGADLDMVLDFFPKLGARLNQQAGTLSGGERKMLGIGRALLGRPQLLLLDEPTEGVWIGVIEEIAERLGQLSAQMGLVVVEQHVDLALRLADYAYVMERGRIALEGPVAEVRDHPDLLRYLAP